MAWQTALPAIAGFLGGPVGALAAIGIQFLADKLGAKEATVDAIKETLQGWTPEQINRAKEIDLEFQKFAMEHGIKIDLAQIEVNKVEAGSDDKFVRRWRPFVGWVGGLAFAYATILEPVARFIAKVVFGYEGEFPGIDTNLTMQVLLGLLGLGFLRTREKEKYVSRY